MVKKIDGFCFKNMIEYGVRNLQRNKKAINSINVFPVPDGDTGTNMATTIKSGVSAIDKLPNNLSEISKKFSKSVVFGARGNSGVIVSQFLKGLCEEFYEREHADGLAFAKALNNGVKSAYSAVSSPVEGTMLTVIKDAAAAVNNEADVNSSLNDVAARFIDEAKRSLNSTPDILPVLKKAGVVDSGGAGIVCFFEGIRKYLDGELVDSVEESTAETVGVNTVDYSKFNNESVFEYGYCTEVLLQLLKNKEDFDFADFKNTVNAYGGSIATYCDNDKLKLHIHTNTPEKVMGYLHRYGEFLAIKIENMSVQHTENVKKCICSPNMSTGSFSIVTVAFDESMQQLFVDMGADVSVYSPDGVSVQDYVDAFDNVSTKHILVFPNSSDAILSALQAKKVYEKANVMVIPSRSTAECYAALPLIDFDEINAKTILEIIISTINKLVVVPVSFSGVSSDGETDEKEADRIFVEKVVKTINNVYTKQNNEVVTIFYGKRVTQKHLDDIADGCKCIGISAELFYVYSENSSRDCVLSFE